MPRLNELFDVSYGSKLDLNKMSTVRAGNPRAVNFVSRSSRNHGISAHVEMIPDIAPFDAGLITVALGGTKLLSSFVQERPFYTAQNVAVLRPKKAMTFAEAVYYCVCIRHNRFRYSAFGREANRTLKTLEVPARNAVPTWVFDAPIGDMSELRRPAGKPLHRPLTPAGWAWFQLQDLFEIKKGKRLTKLNMTPGTTPFVGAIDKNNGVSATVSQPPIHEANTITVNYNGSVAEAFYQPVPYWCSDDVNVLYPKFELNPFRALFLTTVIRKEAYRFNYGRKWHLDRMRQSKIKLPATKRGEPDWTWIESFVRSLPYTTQIESDLSASSS
ncbi:hypothetical protein D7X55_17775 [Corallococcus sp. AB049A]|uniref:restriction endonuclease subunit S n=1 Tax=Corallococcus sp. AB049A TaxID=2316721 RepID=UPI000EC0BF62|nr:restriction endonuclease subunit S [Corallococcus sp. AB049A]RKI64562.1 hypothetical protein D7X55_17775 [Corallococcus sp. AB049A]